MFGATFKFWPYFTGWPFKDMSYIRVHPSKNMFKQKFLKKESVIKTASLEPLWLRTALWALILLSSFAFHFFSPLLHFLSHFSSASPSSHTCTVFTAGSLSVHWPTMKGKFASLHQAYILFLFCSFFWGFFSCCPQWIFFYLLPTSYIHCIVLGCLKENIS